MFAQLFYCSFFFLLPFRLLSFLFFPHELSESLIFFPSSSSSPVLPLPFSPPQKDWTERLNKIRKKSSGQKAQPENPFARIKRRTPQLPIPFPIVLVSFPVDQKKEINPSINYQVINQSENKPCSKKKNIIPKTQTRTPHPTPTPHPKLQPCLRTIPSVRACMRVLFAFQLK